MADFLTDLINSLPADQKAAALAAVAKAEVDEAARVAEIMRPRTHEEIAFKNKINAKIRARKQFSGTPRSL